MATVSELENRLNSFDRVVRSEALAKLLAMVKSGDIKLPKPKNEVNLHIHTFFSFNAYGWSPTRIAWEARKYGLAIAGIVDFDVLDGMEEFLAACDTLEQRGVVSLETRVYVREYHDKVMSSPNEPGIAYFMVAGCFAPPEAHTKAADTLNLMREMARHRNIRVMERVNEYLDTVRIDYDKDVLPLTPSGNATERHMLAAYDAKAREVFKGDQAALASFWAKALGMQVGQIEAVLSDTPKFHEIMRSKLMKFGGVGYVPPTPESFPTLETIVDMAAELGALPTATWLDGTNPGEADMPAFLELMASKGVVAMNIIPDRNWNIKDPEEKKIKVENLDKAIRAARDAGMPLCVGTELNKLGQPFVDNFAAPELRPYIRDFLDGAYFFWGHTFLARTAGIGFCSEWAKANFGDDRLRKNEFYIAVGRVAQPQHVLADSLRRNLAEASPRQVIDMLSAEVG
ncbi:MAG: hypothetical protein QHI38_09990 [Armatimonadota bacterium]|nr:hypothetical protein [Armatimonadota bacterium]